jgi:hypothetical protein
VRSFQILRKPIKPVGMFLNAAATLVLIFAAGCPKSDLPPVGSLSGTVTFQDQPVAEGMICIYNKEQVYANESEIHDGDFNLPGEVRTGTYVVYFTPIPPPPGTRDLGKFPAIPEKYQMENRTDMTVEIKEGHNEVVLAIPEK